MKIAFSPSVYEHAAQWVGRTPWETSRDPELLFEGHRRAWEAYRHSPVVVGIDIYNLEPEAYGAIVDKPEGTGIPAICTPLFTTLKEAAGLSPYDPASAGRIAMVIDVGRRLAASLPQADVRIPVSGPFSIGINLRGITGLCEDMALHPAAAAGWLMQLAENQRGFCQAIAAAGLEVAFFESAAAPPMLSPGQFRQLELPALKHVIAVAEEQVGRPVPCIMGGDTVSILDSLLSTGTDYLVCNVETDQKALVEQVSASHPHVKIRVNMDPGITAGGDREAVLAEVDRVLELVGGRANCLLGTGCLPLETSPDTIRMIREYVDG